MDTVTINVNSTDYTPDPFVVQATDVPSVVANVKQQAESYKQGVLNAVAANETAASQSIPTGLERSQI